MSTNTPDAESEPVPEDHWITEGLIDSMASIARALAPRELYDPALRGALRDLHRSAHLRDVLRAAEVASRKSEG